MDIKAAHKFKTILKNSQEDVWLWMETKNISTFTKLVEEASKYEDEIKNSVTMLAEACAEIRLSSESPNTYLTRMISRLEPFNLPEKDTVNLLANMCYSNRPDLALELKNATSLKDLIMRAEMIKSIAQKQTRKRQIRYNCRKEGHISRNCKKPRYERKDNKKNILKRKSNLGEGCCV